MPDPIAGLPPRFLRTPEDARYLGLSGRTLEKHRTYGTGPTFRKIGGRVVYAVDDLKAWADLGSKTSTSDPGKGTVLPAKKHPVLRPYASDTEPDQVARVLTTEPVGDNALTIYYKTSDGKLHERMLFRTDEAKLSLAEAGRPWAFDAPGEEFKLAEPKPTGSIWRT